MHILAARLFFSFVVSFFITWYIVPIVSKLAYKFNVIDVPDGKIKQHKKPVPYLGGLAVYIGFIVSLAFTAPLQNTLLLLLVGSTLLLLVGLIDDLIALSPAQKFFGQGIAVFCFFKSGLLLKTDFFIGHMWLVPFCILWILTVVNAFNLVDVMDGLATVTAIGATLGFIVSALVTGTFHMALILCAFLGALSGFFVFNKPSASIYLGDAGSLLIGGFLATVPFFLPWGIYNPYGFLCPFLILLVPLFEVISLIVVRTYLGIPFYKASPHHFSIYLQKQGWTKWKILSFVAFVSFFLIIFSTFLLIYPK